MAKETPMATSSSSSSGSSSDKKRKAAEETEDYESESKPNFPAVSAKDGVSYDKRFCLIYLHMYMYMIYEKVGIYDVYDI